MVVVVVLAISALAAVACSSNGGGSTPSDPVLAQGQQVYKAHCATCHGTKGLGGTGMKLAGKVAANFPNIDDQIAVIQNGRSGGMPAWGKSLSADEIRAVARYERECLGTTC
jgi:cbb3-type cytochrome c oxidase subunit III